MVRVCVALELCCVNIVWITAVLSWLQVLVHGEANEMGRLKAALLREIEDMEVHTQSLVPTVI